jgi:hypothetical protein
VVLQAMQNDWLDRAELHSPPNSIICTGLRLGVDLPSYTAINRPRAEAESNSQLPSVDRECSKLRLLSTR